MMQEQSPRFELIPAEYRQCELPEYRGNPLIEAIPPFRTAQELMHVFGKYPDIGKADHLLSPKLRMLATVRLNDYLEPLPHQFDFVEQIETLIVSGYVHRNPTTSAYKKALVDLYRKSMAGSICTIQTSGPATAPSSSLFGISGGGKSTVVERILSFYPQVLSHNKYGFYQFVWLKLDCPLDGSLKQLLRTLISRMDDMLGTNYAEKTKAKTAGVDELVVLVAKIAAQNHLGLLVIDEIQNLLEASGVGPAKMLNFFVTLANEAKIPFCVIGTSRAKTYLEVLFRESRRLSGQGSDFWDRMIPGKEWDHFLRALSKYQWTAKPVDLSEPQLSKAFYFNTQGIRDLVVKLSQLSQLHAIRDGSERINVALLNKVASEKFVLIKKPLDALRSGNPEEIRKYEDLLSSGLLHVRSQVEVEDKQGALEQIRTDEKKRKSDRIRMVSNLAKIGLDERTAQRVVDDLSARTIEATKREEIIAKIAAGDLQSPDESLMKLFKEAKATGADVAKSLSSRGRKATKQAPP